MTQGTLHTQTLGIPKRFESNFWGLDQVTRTKYLLHYDSGVRVQGVYYTEGFVGTARGDLYEINRL